MGVEIATQGGRVSATSCTRPRESLRDVRACVAAAARAIAVLPIVAGCSSADHPGEPLTTSDVATGGSTTAVAETSGVVAPTSSGGGPGLGPDGSCTDDAQCGELRCRADRCDGCSTWEDCPAGLMCWQHACYPVDDLPRCNAVAAPVCGDGVIGALEECEGGPGCVDCQREDALEVVIEQEDLQALFVARDGAMLTLGDLVARWDADAAPSWSGATDFRVGAVAVDAAGGVYLAGSTLGVGFPRVDAWAIDGTPRWSVADPELGVRYVIDADDSRVLVGGSTEQANSPYPRGFIAQYDLDGGLAWSRKVPEWSHAGALVLDGGEATVLGVHLYGPTAWTLMRIDGVGATRWSLELPAEPSALPSLVGMVGDGDGGTWIFGEKDDGPWAAQHDAAGAEVKTLECFGATVGGIGAWAVAPSGAIALVVSVRSGPIPVPKPRLWIAVIEGGEVTRGLVHEEDYWVAMGLGWRPDGRLAIGLRGYYPNEGGLVAFAEL